MSTATPKDCRDDCKFEGAVYEESRIFAHSLGKDIQTKFLHVGWDEQFHNKDGKTVRSASYTPELLASGQCDLYPNNLTENAWRLKKIDIVMLYPSRMMVVVHKSHKKDYRSLKNLQGKRATVQENTSFHTWIDQQNRGLYAEDPIKLLFQPSNMGLKQITDQKVDFTIFDADAALWTTRYEHPELIAAFPVGERDKIGWGFRKTDKELQKAVHQFFQKQRQQPNSEVNQVWTRYYGMSLTRFIGIVSVIR